MDYEDEHEGLTLEQALERYSPPDQYKLERQLFTMVDDAGYHPPVFHMQQKMKWRAVRQPLEAAFRKELENGRFVLCGFCFGEWEAIDPIWLPEAHFDYLNETVVFMPRIYERVRVFGVKPMHEIRAASMRSFVHEADYRHVTLDGNLYVLGELQAKVVKALHKALDNGDGWINGQELLEIAGARSARVMDLFKKTKTVLIESDGHGLYRLAVNRQ